MRKIEQLGNFVIEEKGFSNWEIVKLGNLKTMLGDWS